MPKKDKYIVGLDIGSTKTCVVVAEPNGESTDAAALNFVALGAADSKGWRKGQIVNLDLAISSIRHAVSEAENVVGMPLESAIIGVAGGHVKGLNSCGGVTLGQRPRDIQKEDVRRGIEAARNIQLGEDREVLHVLPQEFRLDHQDSIRDAIGMVGQRLEANVHIVTASALATQNIVTAVNRAGVVVSDTVLESLAAAESCLTQDERELGACLLDIGGGTTEFIAYNGGVVRHTGVVPIGGDHFTSDLAVGLRTPIPEAEKIKREVAVAWREMGHQDLAIQIATVGDRPPRTVHGRMITEILEARAQELIALVFEELRREGLDTLVPAGLVLTGGGSRLRGLPELAEKMLSLQVRIAAPRGLHGATDEILQPEYSAAIGLVLYGARVRRAPGAKSAGWTGKLKALFAGQSA